MVELPKTGMRGTESNERDGLDWDSSCDCGFAVGAGADTVSGGRNPQNGSYQEAASRLALEKGVSK